MTIYGMMEPAEEQSGNVINAIFTGYFNNGAYTDESNSQLVRSFLCYFIVRFEPGIYLCGDG